MVDITRDDYTFTIEDGENVIAEVFVNIDHLGSTSLTFECDSLDEQTVKEFDDFIKLFEENFEYKPKTINKDSKIIADYFFDEVISVYDLEEEFSKICELKGEEWFANREDFVIDDTKELEEEKPKTKNQNIFSR